MTDDRFKKLRTHTGTTPGQLVRMNDGRIVVTKGHRRTPVGDQIVATLCEMRSENLDDARHIVIWQPEVTEKIVELLELGLELAQADGVVGDEWIEKLDAMLDRFR